MCTDLCKSYEEFVLRSNYEECRNYLQEFKLNIDKVSTIYTTVTLIIFFLNGGINPNVITYN